MNRLLQVEAWQENRWPCFIQRRKNERASVGPLPASAQSFAETRGVGSSARTGIACTGPSQVRRRCSPRVRKLLRSRVSSELSHRPPAGNECVSTDGV